MLGGLPALPACRHCPPACPGAYWVAFLAAPLLLPGARSSRAGHDPCRDRPSPAPPPILPVAGRRNFADFLSQYIAPLPGRFVDVDTGADLGPCPDVAAVTHGQRPGVGGAAERVYTAGKDVVRERLRLLCTVRRGRRGSGSGLGVGHAVPRCGRAVGSSRQSPTLQRQLLHDCKHVRSPVLAPSCLTRSKP